jgi:hypothetical protein
VRRTLSIADECRHLTPPDRVATNAFSVPFFLLRVAMVVGGAAILLFIAFSGSDGSIAVRDWTLFRVLLAESVLCGWLSAMTLDHFRHASGDREPGHSSTALKVGLGGGLVLAFTCGVVLVSSQPQEKMVAAALFVLGAMLTFGFAILMWVGYLASRLLQRLRGRKDLNQVVSDQRGARP